MTLYIIKNFTYSHERKKKYRRKSCVFYLSSSKRKKTARHYLKILLYRILFHTFNDKLSPRKNMVLLLPYHLI